MKASHVIGLALLALTAPVMAYNSIKFVNHCPYDIWFWTVGPLGSNIDGSDNARITVPGNHGTTVHGMVNTELIGGGLSLKMRDVPHYQAQPAGIVQVEYHLEPSKNSIWYDLSIIDCNSAVGPENPAFCPLIGGGIKMHIPEAKKGSCPPAWCSAGKCQSTYEMHGSWYGEPSFMCPVGADIYIETCTESAGPQTFQGQGPQHPHSPAPAPYPAPKPVPEGPLVVSPAGLCGGSIGETCAGSRWGSCCSAWGYCGSGPEYCSNGCQSAFGECSGSTPGSGHGPKSPPAPFPAPSATPKAPEWVPAPHWGVTEPIQTKYKGVAGDMAEVVTKTVTTTVTVVETVVATASLKHGREAQESAVIVRRVRKYTQ